LGGLTDTARAAPWGAKFDHHALMVKLRPWGRAPMPEGSHLACRFTWYGFRVPGFGFWEGLGFEVSGFGVWGLGFEVWGSGFGVWGSGLGVWYLGFGVSCLVFGVWGSRVLVVPGFGTRVRPATRWGEGFSGCWISGFGFGCAGSTSDADRKPETRHSSSG
jgi:hypothetical protein